MRTPPAVLALLLVACGGTAVQDPVDEHPTTEAPASQPQDAGSATDSAFKEVPLGDCSAGFDPREQPSQPCNWVGEDGRCYDTRDQACNCNCPRTKDSICSSEFYRGEGQATPVFCG